MPQGRGRGLTGNEVRLSAANYKADKAAGRIAIKAKVQANVFMEKKRYSPHTGEELDPIVVVATEASLEAEKATHVTAIESIDEALADIAAMPE